MSAAHAGRVWPRGEPPPFPPCRPSVLIRPYGRPNFLLDVAPGDIWEASGDSLLCGRPHGLVAPDGSVGDAAVLPGESRWRPASGILSAGMPAARRRGPTGGWHEVVACGVRPKGTVRIPDRPDDSGRGYERLFGAMIWPLHVAADVAADVAAHVRPGVPPRARTVGVIPVSCRRPDAVAWALAEAVAELFRQIRGMERAAALGPALTGGDPIFAVRTTALTVIVRSLGDFAPLAAAFDRRAFRRYLETVRGDRGGAADPWRPAGEGAAC